MNQQTVILLLSALSVGVIHTLLGPDHYLPFIVLARARGWSITKTVIITTLCGIGHVLSAVLLGVVAISIGITLGKLDFIETFRGEIAAWLLIGFGFTYFVWSVHAVIRKKYGHFHVHADCTAHTHLPEKKSLKELTPWILFIIFVLGPCEPLIPLVMYPAIQKSLINVFLVTLVFGLGTLFVMLFMVVTSTYYAEKASKLPFFERYGNMLAGGIICGCGLAIKFLGV